MEELIKRLERVIATGAPDKDGQHPISAETVLEVVKGLSEHGTNLAEVGTDCISRQAAIDAFVKRTGLAWENLKIIQPMLCILEELPSAQPEIIYCKDCKWWDKYNDNMGYCMAARHTAYSTNWEIQIRRTYKGDFYCAHAELEEENMDEVETE